MFRRHAQLWRAAFARALFIATSLTATPAVGCQPVPAGALAAQLGAVMRFDFGPAQLPPFLALWEQHRAEPLPALPDSAAVLARADRRLIVAFLRAGCLIALQPVSGPELWRALHLHIGPIA